MEHTCGVRCSLRPRARSFLPRLGHVRQELGFCSDRANRLTLSCRLLTANCQPATASSRQAPFVASVLSSPFTLSPVYASGIKARGTRQGVDGASGVKTRGGVKTKVR